MASSRRIWVGNLPYNATEEQVKALCEEVGPVVSFKLVTDKDTEKPKGFGFCEFRDEATAFSALRNLQGCELNGRRLNVNFAANEKSNHRPIGLQAAADAAAAVGGSKHDALTVHLSKMSRNQLAQMVSEVKGIAVGNNKEMAHEMLLAVPQLNRALLQGLIMLGMVTPPMVEKVVMRPMPQQQVVVPKSEPVQVSAPLQMGAVPMSNMGQQPHLRGVVKSEPVAQTLSAGVDPDVMQQVLNIPPERVASLAPELREQVMQIQQVYRREQAIRA